MATPLDQRDKKSSDAVRSWLWPPRPFTFGVVGCVLVIAFFANVPAIKAPHVVLEGKHYGVELELNRHYEHGWPLRYSRRYVYKTSKPPSIWRPWEGPLRWDTLNLLVDVVVWGGLIALAACFAQWWRAYRPSIWRFHLRDVLVLTLAVGIPFAWVGYERLEYLGQQSLMHEIEARYGPNGRHKLEASIPLWLPEGIQSRYHEAFGRVSFFHSEGDTDLASQHHSLLCLRETAFHKDFPKHLRQMPQLEAIDLMLVKLPYFDATRQATILRDLPAVPNLRGINLCYTNATDADMIWIAKCRRLELIDLAGVEIGNEGIDQLQRLPNLRCLTLSSDRVTDDTCRRLAQFPALTHLNLASRSITDEGIRELSALNALRHLRITASASEGAFVDLQKALPECEVHAKSYLPGD